MFDWENATVHLWFNVKWIRTDSFPWIQNENFKVQDTQLTSRWRAGWIAAVEGILERTMWNSAVTEALIISNICITLAVLGITHVLLFWSLQTDEKNISS